MSEDYSKMYLVNKTNSSELRTWEVPGIVIDIDSDLLASRPSVLKIFQKRLSALVNLWKKESSDE